MAALATPPIGAASRRARRAVAPTGQPTPAGAITPTQPSAPTQNTTGPTPTAAPQPIAAQLGTPSAAQTWVNPYATSYSYVPVASPPANPDLTPQDVAAQIAEYSSWDQYLSNIGLTAAQMSASTATKVQDIEQAMAQGLENNNWDTASRGISGSSISANNATQISSDAATQQGAATTALGNYENYAAGENAKFYGQGGVKQSIDAKYIGIGGQNKAAAAAANPPVSPVPATPQTSPSDFQPNGAPVKGVDRTPAPAPQKGVVRPLTPPGVFMQTQGTRAGLRYIIKDGTRFYESKAGSSDWGKGGKVAQ